VILETILAPSEICYLLGVCPAPPPPPVPSNYIPVRSNLSDTTGERQWPSWNLTTGTGTFVHITDIHVDLQYEVGTNSTCSMPVCCRAQFGPGNSTHSAGAWGDYACDPPQSLVESLFEHIASLDPVPDFIIYTGDDPAHGTCVRVSVISIV
jgi:sphingomyelin phosphodiesterase